MPDNADMGSAAPKPCTLHLQHGPRGDRELRFYELVKELAEECTPDLTAALRALDPFAPARPPRPERRRASFEGKPLTSAFAVAQIPRTPDRAAHAGPAAMPSARVGRNNSIPPDGKSGEHRVHAPAAHQRQKPTMPAPMLALGCWPWASLFAAGVYINQRSLSTFAVASVCCRAAGDKPDAKRQQRQQRHRSPLHRREWTPARQCHRYSCNPARKNAPQSKRQPAKSGQCTPASTQHELLSSDVNVVLPQDVAC